MTFPDDVWVYDCIDFYREHHQRMPTAMEIWRWKDALTEVTFHAVPVEYRDLEETIGTYSVD